MWTQLSPNWQAAMTMTGSVEFRFGDVADVVEKAYGDAESGKLLFVLSDSVAVSQAKEMLLKSREVVDGGPFLTFEDIENRIMLSAACIRPLLIPDYVRRVIASEIVGEMAGRHRDRFHLERQFSSVLLEEFDSVWPSVIHAGSAVEKMLKGVAQNESEKRRYSTILEFAALYQSRMSALSNSGIYDRVILAHEAATHASALRNQGVERVMVVGMVFADGVLLDLLKAMSESISVTIVLMPSDRGRKSVQLMMRRLGADGFGTDKGAGDARASSLGIFGAPDRRRELREVARRILQEINDKTLSLGDFAVVARSISEYDDIAREVFSEYGIALEGGGRKRLRDTRMYSFLRKILDLIAGDITKSKLMSLLEHDFFPVANSRLGELAVSVAHLPELIDIETGESPLGDISLPWGETLISWLKKSHMRAASPMRLEEWVGFALELISGASTELLADEEYLANGEFIRSLIEVSSASAAYRTALPEMKLDLSSFIEILEDFAYDKTYAAGEEGQGLLFTDAGLLYFRKFAHIFAVGMSEEVFPFRQRDGMFLRTTMVDSISRMTSAARTSTDAVDSIEGHIFDSILDSSAAVTFSYVYSDERGRRLLPSTFVLNTLEKCMGRSRLLERIEERNLDFSAFYPEDGAVWSVHELDRLRASSVSGEGAIIDESGENGAVKAEFTDVVERGRIADADPLEWRIPPEKLMKLVGDRTLSATDLSEYAKCPFRYVATRILSAVPSMPPMNPLDRGAQMHEILKRFYEQHGLEYLRCKPLNEVQAEMERCTDEYFVSKYGSTSSMGLMFSIHVADIKSALLEFIGRDAGDETLMKGELVGLEQRFGYSDQKEFLIGGHRFRGIIDRVETVDIENGNLLVYDYKSGNPDNLTRKYFRADGPLLDFGVPLYALYLNDVENKKLAGAFYYMLLKADDRPDRAGIAREEALENLPGVDRRKRSYFSIKPGQEFDEEISRLREAVCEVSDSITSGIFRVEPREGECEYCQHFAICRYGGQV